MSSRLRDDVRRLFECWCEVMPSRPDRDSYVSRKFPDSFKDEEIIKSVPKFAFPCEVEITVVQHFSFVLTSLDGKWTFGFCRHDPQRDTALVMLTHLPWHDVFYKFLNTIAHVSKTTELGDFLATAYASPVPEPDQILRLPYNRGDCTFMFQAPSLYQLPKIPENRNLTEYYSAVDTDAMMEIFAAILAERRVIFTSKRLGRLSSCVQAAIALLYPMVWQNIFIPVLPLQLIDYLQAPMPYLIGVPEPVLKKVRMSDLGEVVVLYADDNRVETPFDDLSLMPPEIVASLRKQFKNKSALLGDGVSRAFLKTIVQLTKGYRDALQFKHGAMITFNPEVFVESRQASYRPFLRSMLKLQIFQQFIEDRLNMLNSGMGFSDEFEKEAAINSEHNSGRFKQQYKEWAGHMRKEGSAFFRSVKDKANPAVKSAVKSVKDSGKGMKSAYRGFKSKFRDSTPDSHLTVYSRPSDGHRSAPDSPIVHRRPHSSFGVASKSYRKEVPNNNTLSHSTTGTSSDDSPYKCGGIQVEMESQTEIDLMGELQNHALFRNLPIVDRSLKPTWSIDSRTSRGAPPPSAPNSLPDVPTATLCVFDSSPNSSLNSSNRSSVFDSPPLPCSLPGFGQIPVSPQNGVLMEPIVPPRPYSSTAQYQISRDLFGAAPFVQIQQQQQQPVGVLGVGGLTHNTKRKEEPNGDLISLDSSNDFDDFDPLSSRCNTLPTNNQIKPMRSSLSNPIYPFFTPSHTQHRGDNYSNSTTMASSHTSINTTTSNRSTIDQHDKDLLKEYGLDFNKFNLSFHNNGDLIGNNNDLQVSNENSPQKQWTKFE